MKMLTVKIVIGVSIGIAWIILFWSLILNEFPEIQSYLPQFMKGSN